MKKNGFTLIELLAVIVILAIIALIATPIILNIIEDTKNSATLRSADFYLDAVELSVAHSALDNIIIEDGAYPVMDSGNLCLEGTISNCSKELVVGVGGDVPNSGSTITITARKINNVSLNYDNKTVVKDSSGSLIFSEDNNNASNNIICRAATEKEKGAGNIPNGTYNPGDAYICEVKEGVEYLFYVLSTNSNSNAEIESVNLIMNGNIYYDSDTGTSSLVSIKTATNPENTGILKWSDDSKSGPVTAMTYLHNATKSWSNIPNMIMDYTDEGQTENTGYGTITTTNEVTTITKKDGTVTLTIEEPLKARLPMRSEVADYNEELGNQYLYDNLALYCYISDVLRIEASCDEAGYKIGLDVEGVSYIPEGYFYSGIQEGYWFLSSYDGQSASTYTDAPFDDPSEYVLSVRSNKVFAEMTFQPFFIGVRPVITISTSSLS